MKTRTLTVLPLREVLRALPPGEADAISESLTRYITAGDATHALITVECMREILEDTGAFDTAPEFWEYIRHVPLDIYVDMMEL